jgi:hypothetical protein
MEDKTRATPDDLLDEIRLDRQKHHETMERASSDAVRTLGIIHGGAVIALVTWIQACLGPNSTPTQKALVPGLLWAIGFGVVGLVLTVILPVLDARLAKWSSYGASAYQAAALSMKSGDGRVLEHHENAERARKALARIDRLWWTFASLSVAAFAAMAIVVICAVRSAI